MLLEGKKALVTGARKGIGRGIAVMLAREGADVGVNDIVDDAETRKTANMATKAGRNATVHIGDVSKIQDINRVVEEFVKAHGGIDILINNAIFPDQSRPLFETDEAYWDRMMNLSLKGYFFAAQRAAKEMVSQGRGGRIVSLSSVHAYRAWKDWTAYGIAKAGLRRMAMGLAVDLAGTGVTANCIAPGAINNQLTEDGVDPAPYDLEKMPWLKARVPSQRGGLPSDIANAILFLCSKMGDYVNGETILVDGGLIISGGELR
ncbi:MAG: SDR family oxidoreductase [Chloroflexi bacterium]|nr:SDR family oxidoreductase [Chloroflexota bacterium]